MSISTAIKPQIPRGAVPDNFAVIKWGYDRLVLPLDDGLLLMKCLAKAEKYTTTWNNNENTPHIGGKLPDMGLDLLAGVDYMTGKITGPEEK